MLSACRVGTEQKATAGLEFETNIETAPGSNFGQSLTWPDSFRPEAPAEDGQLTVCTWTESKTVRSKLFLSLLHRYCNIECVYGFDQVFGVSWLRVCEQEHPILVSETRRNTEYGFEKPDVDF